MIEAFAGQLPQIAVQSVVHASAVVIGNVAVGERVSVWPCAVLRGDMEKIVVGDDTNLQDGCIVHTSAAHPVTIGRRVTVGHGAKLHGCSIGDDCLIGIGAIVLDGAVVETGAVVGAGSLVPPGGKVRPGRVVVGSPAREIRAVKPEESEANIRAAIAYWERAKQIVASTVKNERERDSLEDQDTGNGRG